MSIGHSATKNRWTIKHNTTEKSNNRLTLFRPGGGADSPPARTLDVDNSFNKQAKATELGNVS